MFKAYGLYTQIRQNHLRSILLLAGFVVLLQALGFAFALLIEAAYGGTLAQIVRAAVSDYAHDWPIAMAAAAVWFAIAYAFHQSIIDFATGAGGVARQDVPKLYNALENLCISRGLPMPQLKIIEIDGLNAFSSGLRDSNYSIAVTRGLLKRLDDAELEAVLAHELTHIRNRDTQLLVVALIFAGIFTFVGDLIFRFWGFGFPSRRSSDEEERRSGGGAIIAVIIALVIIAISWGLSVLIRFALSRTREYLADSGSVELTKNPDALISALRKIERYPQIPNISERVSGFFIESPTGEPQTGWFSTHPSIEDRIAALVRYDGGHYLPPQPEAPEAAQAPPLLPQEPSGPWGAHKGPWG
ncbi:MAG TPA: M48 family metallopeptidase [Methylovirgula sp.]|nr:M48 family metallopeptidase [Methylovirgula sp.]